MSGWVKVPEEWLGNPEVEELDAEIVVFHLSALAQCARHSLDGILRRSDVRKLWPALDVDKAVDSLERLGWWQPNAVGWLIRDWQTFILSAAEVEKRREVSRATSERYRRHKAGDHSMCDRCAAVRRGDTSRDVSGDASVTTSVTHSPNRSGPLGEEREDAAAGSAGAPPARLGPHPVDLAGFEGECDVCPLPIEHPIHAGMGWEYEGVVMPEQPHPVDLDTPCCPWWIEDNHPLHISRDTADAANGVAR